MLFADGVGRDAACAQSADQLLSLPVDQNDARRARPHRMVEQIRKTCVIGNRQRHVDADLLRKPGFRCAPREEAQPIRLEIRKQAPDARMRWQQHDLARFRGAER